MQHLAIFFLMVGAFFMEWHLRGFKAACHELKVYWNTRDTYIEPENEENY